MVPMVFMLSTTWPLCVISGFDAVLWFVCVLCLSHVLTISMLCVSAVLKQLDPRVKLDQVDKFNFLAWIYHGSYC